MENENFAEQLRKLSDKIYEDFLESEVMKTIKETAAKKATQGFRNITVSNPRPYDGLHKDAILGMIEYWADNEGFEVEGIFPDNEPEDIRPEDRNYERLSISW